MTVAKNESDKCKIELADERDRSLQTVSSLNDCTARSEALTKKNAILTSSKESLQSTLNNFQETCAETDQRLNHTSYTLSETQEGLRLCLDDKKATKLELERLKSPMQEIERINSQMGFVFDATNTNAVADAVTDKRDTHLPPWLNPAHLWTVIGVLLLALLLVVTKTCYDEIETVLKKRPRTSKNVFEYAYSYAYSTFARRPSPRCPPTPLTVPPTLPQPNQPTALPTTPPQQNLPRALPPTAAEDNYSIYNEVFERSAGL